MYVCVCVKDNLLVYRWHLGTLLFIISNLCLKVLGIFLSRIVIVLCLYNEAK